MRSVRCALVLTLLLSACSASTGAGQYRQGAPMPPAFSPMEDAPHTLGQPGYVEARPVERSPHTRVLPQTPESWREAGVWAGDGPSAKTRAITQPPMRLPGEPIPAISILTIPVPVHEYCIDGAMTNPSEQCAYAVESGLYSGDMSLAVRAMRLTPEQRACLAAMAHWRCLTWLQQEYKRNAGAKWSADVNTSILMATDASVRWISRVCPLGKGTPEIPKILDALETAETRSPKWAQ